MLTIASPNYTSGRTRQPWIVVVHDMEAPEGPATAENVARYFQDPNVQASAHVNADEDSLVRCVADGDTAWTAGWTANDAGLHIELAGYARQTRADWLDRSSSATIAQAAGMIRTWCQTYDIPPRKVTAADLQAGRGGICGHADTSAAWRETDHTDPGPGFPWDVLLAQVGGAPQVTPLGGRLTHVAQCSWAPGRVDWVGRAGDGSIWHTYADNGTPSGKWDSLAGATDTSPAVCSWGKGRLDVFVVGKDRALWHKAFYGGGWHGWERLGGQITTVAASADAAGRLWVTCTAPDRSLWYRRWDGSRWSDWQT